jgi:putative nucleotidyltransferase with HDIG domain
MGYVAVDNLKQGMVLGEDVQDINTRLILPKGKKLEHKHLRVLKIWGISEVDVVGGDKNETVEKSVPESGQLENIKNSINLVFKNAELKNGNLKEIYKISLIHRLKENIGTHRNHTAIPCGENSILSNREQILKIIKKVDKKLPEAPTIISELNKVIADPLATSNDVAQIVTKSPSLTATLLKIVNSAYYGFPSKIDCISRAVTIIGTKEISGLALGICVMQAFKDIPTHILDMNAFIRHSLSCGMIARILGALNNIPQTEQLFVSGLLHDIGKLIVYKYFPDHAITCFCLSESCGTSVFQAEKKIIGLNHTKIAKNILREWNLPNDLTDNIVYHHMPRNADDPIKAGVVHIADILSHGIGIGYSGERSIPMFDYQLIDKILNSTQNIQMVIRQAVHQLAPLEAIFHSD